MMGLPLHIARKLAELLANGNALPASELKHAVINKMLEDGLLDKQVQGRQKAKIRLQHPDDLRAYLFNHFGIENLDMYIQALEQPTLSRSEAVAAASDSKLSNNSVFKGFLVNVLAPLDCTLNGQSFTLQATPGVSTFIAQYEHFLPPPAATVVGFENTENFQYLQQQAYLFNAIGPVIFVCRYPQNAQLLQWLSSIPNLYLHFGDLDFAGMRIYLSEYKNRLGERARFFLPSNAEQLIKARGNKALYSRQYHLRPGNEMLPEPGLMQLLDWLNHYKKGLEQEVFIGLDH